MKKKNFSILIVVAIVAGMISGCGVKEASTVTAIDVTEPEEIIISEEASADVAEGVIEDTKELSPITILYTNDVHAYVNNENTDEDGNVTKGLSYSSVAAMKAELEAAGENVLLVDAGDHAQGTIFGAIDEGATVQELMKETGYDVATPGNHEFDYGQFRALDIIKNSPTPYISCNFYSIETGELVLPAYKVFDVNGTKVAFVGITTPDTITSSAPVVFQNEKGEFIYQIYAGTNGQELYDSVQKAIDEASSEADYVIALGHCGVDPSSEPYRSTDIIANVSGLTAFIDGHSHTTMEGNIIKDKEGRDVMLTQTGSFFNAIGKMRIDIDGTVSTALASEYANRDVVEDKTVADLVTAVDEKMGEKIATSKIPFYVTNAENPEERLVRRQETNMANLVADSVYWYFNDVEDLNCDIAICNGGGVRTDILAGDWTYFETKSVCPFGNVICLIEVTGQEFLDCLELGANVIGVHDENGNPAENGGFIHVSGVKYDIDSKIESSVALDENGIWQASPSGEYKVKNVQIYNKETKEYEDLDLEKTYALGGINYILRNGGNGMTMFADSKLVKDYVGEDYLIFSEYLKAFAANDSGTAEIASENSPLAAYDNFGIDYENPLGSGRIVIK